jgi:hypothetical protein
MIVDLFRQAVSDHERLVGKVVRVRYFHYSRQKISKTCYTDREEGFAVRVGRQVFVTALVGGLGDCVETKYEVELLPDQSSGSDPVVWIDGPTYQTGRNPVVFWREEGEECTATS